MAKKRITVKQLREIFDWDDYGPKRQAAEDAVKAAGYSIRCEELVAWVMEGNPIETWVPSQDHLGELESDIDPYIQLPGFPEDPSKALRMLYDAGLITKTEFDEGDAALDLVSALLGRLHDFDV